MSYVLLATPLHPEDMQGHKGEMLVHSGTLASCREKSEWWNKQGETTRIVSTRTGREMPCSEQ